jgi:hypothetical protein
MNRQGQQKGGDATHERKDADVIGLFMVAGLLLLILAMILLVCWGIFHLFSRERAAQQPLARRPRAMQVTAFPPPRLLVRPAMERAKFQAAERTQLNSYGWINRSGGIVRIPIGRAMQLLLERGLPEVGAGETRLQLMQSRPQTNVQPNEPISAPGPEATP